MTIWLLFAVMTAAAVMAILWPLSRRAEPEPADDPGAQFYRDQIAEIERDVDRGLLSPIEAEGAKAEAGRRLLRSAAASGEVAAHAVGEPALRRRRAVSALALSAVPLLALAVYGAFGSPHSPAQPFQARFRAGPQDLDLVTALARIEAHLAQNPQDGRGWEVVAPVYLRTGRADDAVKAYEAALRILGEDATRLANYGEARVAAGAGVITAEARQAFERALALDGTAHKARFYLARAAEQDGDADRARMHYTALLTSSPVDAAWTAMVKERLARLDDSAASPPDPRAGSESAAIAGMVRGLAARLEAQGGTADEWGRLIRSYVVLGERQQAAATLARARRELAQDQGGLAGIDAMADELGLVNEPKP